MQLSSLLLVLTGLSLLSYQLGRRRAIGMSSGRDGPISLHSLPQFHGLYVMFWCLIPAGLVLLAWYFLQNSVLNQLLIAGLPAEIQLMPAQKIDLLLNDIRNVAGGAFGMDQADPVVRAAAGHLNSLAATARASLVVVVLSVAIAGLGFSWRRLSPGFRSRNRVEFAVNSILVACSMVAILTTIGIVLSVLFESLRFFQSVSPLDFMFGLDWSPQTAIRSDQIGASGAFGAVPLFAGTLMVSAIAMLVAAPIGLMSAIYLAEYASARVRAIGKPMLEILAGIPTVVYGFFAALTVAPTIRGFGGSLGLTVSSESALAAGLVMGIMIIPFVSSLSDDVISAVPQSLRDGSYGMGATRSETIRLVLIPAALPGIVGSLLLAVSRAIGETMIVVMAAGLAANLTANPLESVTTVTVQIVTLLVGDQEFDSPKTLAAFALALMLFVSTLALNFAALRIVRKYREQYQ